MTGCSARGSRASVGRWWPSWRPRSLLPAAWWFRSQRARAGATLVIVGGTAIAVASVLAIAFPPTFQVASWGPWVAALGGTIAVGRSDRGGIDRIPSRAGCLTPAPGASWIPVEKHPAARVRGG